MRFTADGEGVGLNSALGQALEVLFTHNCDGQGASWGHATGSLYGIFLNGRNFHGFVIFFSGAQDPE